MEHLPLVAVRPAGVRPSVISGDGEDGQSAVVNLQRHGRHKEKSERRSQKQPMKEETDETGRDSGCQGDSHTTGSEVKLGQN